MSIYLSKRTAKFISPVFFQAANPSGEINFTVRQMEHKGIHSRGYLPHWDFADSVQGITFRLADSVPAGVIREWREELQSSLDSTNLEIAGKAHAELHRKISKYEDAGHGACLLGDHVYAEIVQDELLKNHGLTYKLIEWCIMPNHVHVLIRLMGTVALGVIVKQWKAGSAVQINRLLERSGSIWMRDYHDRLVRDLDHFHAARNYIRNNPVAAELCERQEGWVFSSAGRQWGVELNSSPEQAK